MERKSQVRTMHGCLLNNIGKTLSPSRLADLAGMDKSSVLQNLSALRKFAETNGEILDTIHRSRYCRNSRVMGVRLDNAETIQKDPVPYIQESANRTAQKLSYSAARKRFDHHFKELPKPMQRNLLELEEKAISV